MKGVIEMCQDVGASVDETVSRLIAKFAMTYEDATNYVNQFWRN